MDLCADTAAVLTGLLPGTLGASLVAQMVKKLPAKQETQFNPWVRKIPWRRKRQLTSVFLPGESHGQRNLLGYNPWYPKELDMTERPTLSPGHNSYLLNLSLPMCIMGMG